MGSNCATKLPQSESFPESQYALQFEKLQISAWKSYFSDTESEFLWDSWIKSGLQKLRAAFKSLSVWTLTAGVYLTGMSPPHHVPGPCSAAAPTAQGGGGGWRTADIHRNRYHTRFKLDYFCSLLYTRWAASQLPRRRTLRGKSGLSFKKERMKCHPEIKMYYICHLMG